MIPTPYAPDGLLLSATTAAMRSARCLGLIDAAARETTPSLHLNRHLQR
jgi:hypothetical protein